MKNKTPRTISIMTTVFHKIDNEIFLYCKKNKNNLYEIPFGKLLKNETVENAVKAICSNQLGLKISEDQFYYKYSIDEPLVNIEDYVFKFSALLVDVNLILNNDIVSININEIDPMKFEPIFRDHLIYE